MTERQKAKREPLEPVRRRYAEDLAATSGMTDAALVDAFAAVPREAFVGPEPWDLRDPDGQTERADDPRRLYRNVIVDGEPGSGEPWFMARMFARLGPCRGGRIIHIGAGGGYYSAILAETVGPKGRITAIELEPVYAALAADALAPWPNVEVLDGDAHRLAAGPADAIVATFGLDQPPPAWVRLLKDGGRLVMPLTMDSRYQDVGAGALLEVTRRGAAFDAAFIGSLMIRHDRTGRTPRATRRLTQAFPRVRPGQMWEPPKIGSLHLNRRPGWGCWLYGDGWWISRNANP